VASEAAQEDPERRTLCLAISQSGETADELHAVASRVAGESPRLALTNNSPSTLTRRADAVMTCAAGPETGVVATKTFVCQIIAGVAVMVSAIVATSRLYAISAARLVDDLRRVELTYRWAEHYPAGEFKHGPLALVGAGTPVVVVDNADPKLATNVAEVQVQARGGRIISIGSAGSAVPVMGSLVAPCGPLQGVGHRRLGTADMQPTLGIELAAPFAACSEQMGVKPWTIYRPRTDTEANPRHRSWRMRRFKSTSGIPRQSWEDRAPSEGVQPHPQ
jgi:glucosamine--fructose-6-phosphate aminotransferase (isomerizing)